MPRRTRKVHFPKPARGRTLCGIYVVGGGTFAYTGIRITANFNEVDCDECRKHKGFTEALYQFEIGEYSWPEWLATYAPPPKPQACGCVGYCKCMPVCSTCTTPRMCRYDGNCVYSAQSKEKPKPVISGADLLAKFEARSKRK